MSDAPDTGQAWIDNDGNFSQIDTAPETVRDFISKKNFGNINDMVKSYTELESYKGVPADRFAVIPEKEDDEEGWSKFYSKVRPEKPEGYKFAGQFPEGVEIPDEELANFSNLAHKMNLSNKQFNAILDYYGGLAKTGNDFLAQQQQEEADAQQKSRNKAWETLKKQYSVKTDEQMQELVKQAINASEKLGLSKTFKRLKLEDDPVTISELIEVSKKLSDSIIPGHDGGGGMDKNARLQEIMNNPAFLDRMHKDHDRIMKEYHELFGIKR
jgi:hypothetical protein